MPGNLWRPTEKLLFFNGLLGNSKQLNVEPIPSLEGQVDGRQSLAGSEDPRTKSPSAAWVRRTDLIVATFLISQSVIIGNFSRCIALRMTRGNLQHMWPVGCTRLFIPALLEYQTRVRSGATLPGVSQNVCDHMTANDSLAPNLAVVILHGRYSPISPVNRRQCAHDSPNPCQGRNARYPRIDRSCSDRCVIPAFPFAVGRVEDQVNLT
ncbi:MAG: hypothetical protein ACI8QS_003629, partial [Planctomycetota bacterium]